MASNSDSQSSLIPIFDGDDYDYWKIKIRTVLRAEGLWNIVEKGFAEPEDEADLSEEELKKLESSRRQDARALSKLQMGVTKPIFTRISTASTAKEAWEILEGEFHGDEKVRSINLQSLKKDFQNLRMKDSENIQSYHARVMEIVNQMKTYGDNISDQHVVEKILISLTDKYEYIVAVIEETKDLTKLSIKELMGSLQAHEKRRMKQAEQSENAFLSKAKMKPQQFAKKGGQNQEQKKPDWRNKRENYSSTYQKNQYDRGTSSNPKVFCNICKRTSHVSSKCWFKGKPQCNFCRRFGHVEKDCRFKNYEKANFTEEQEDGKGEQIFYACHSSLHGDNKAWYIDSGCSNHMCEDRNIFVQLDTTINPKVRMGNGAVAEAQGKGTVAINTKSGIKYIRDVLLVPDLKENLLSVGQLLEHNYCLVFEDNMCRIFEKKNKNQAIAEVKMEKNRNFPLIFNYNALKAEVEDQSWLWHKRYCHLNFQGLKLLKERNMVNGLPKLQHEKNSCEGCIMGKQHKLPYPSGKSWRAKERLELIHTDICGPMKTTSLGQQRYFIIFIDDFTRMTWIYFLKEKSEAFTVFKRFKALVEKQSGRNIKCIRSDRGGEYTSRQFEEYCKDEGIWKQLTAGYSPQQNGIAERKNRTIVEMARSMMNEKGLPKTFWAEATNTAVYILNRCPTKAVRNLTPMEAWSREKPDVSHLRIFGSIGYVLIPAEKRTKLDEKSTKCIFTGYTLETKGYRLYNVETNKLVVSRDVLFDENAAWDWKEKKVEHVNQPSSLESSEEHEDTHTEEAEQNPEQDQHTQTSESEEESPPRKFRSMSDIYQSCNFVVTEPQNFEEAEKHEIWQKAMKEEMHMIDKNKTWELVDKPQGREIIKLKWIYKTKVNQNGEIQKHKARLVARGFTQKPGIDFSETFSPVARLETIRTLIALAAQKKWKIFQLDVKSAFLNGKLEEEIYVEQPQGFLVEGGENKVYRLLKALYGLKQSPRAWYKEIDKYFMKNGFQRSKNEATLYVKKQGSKILIACLYVDDLIVTGNDEEMIESFKEHMMKTYEMSDLGLLHYFLGIEVSQGGDGIFVSQKRYAKSILEKFNMTHCKPVSTPLVVSEKLSKEDGTSKVDCSLYRSLVGSLLYLTATRPEIMFAATLLSRFMQNPSQTHFGAAKRILRYLQGTLDYGIFYKAGENLNLIAYSDSDWAGSIDDMKSTSGYAFLLGTNICSWLSKKQKVVAQSSAEAEYVAAAKATSQAIWLRRILEDIGEKQQEATILFCDNKSAISIAKNPVNHERTKHIAIKYHFIRDAVEQGEIQLEYCKTQEQLADIFTKALPKEKFCYLRERIGVVKQVH